MFWNNRFIELHTLVTFFRNKKMRKIPIIFDIENWLWKSNFSTFWKLAINQKLKMQNFPFGTYVASYAKIFLILCSPDWISTTHFAITYVVILVTLLQFDWSKHILIKPSSFSRCLSAHKTKRIFQMLWCIFEGRTNMARPSQPSMKKCQNGTF